MTVNWASVLATTSSITVILVALGAVVVRSIKRSIRDEVADIIKAEVTPSLTRLQARLDGHDTRLARLEGVEEGRRQAVAEAGVTTTAAPR